MKRKTIALVVLLATFGFTQANAQINLGEKALGAVQKGVAGFTFSDADAAALSKEAVAEMDAKNQIAPATDGYAIRLNRLFGKHTAGEGYTLNYKVYMLKEVNAFATADGSVRVYSGLMDIMDDNELLAVIGHEIGHVANHDSRDAMKAAYKKEALIDAAASQSAKISALTDTQLVKIGNAMIDSKHSRTQESEADLFSYNFMKKNGYNVNAEESAFRILAKMSEGAEGSFLDKMMSSHPDSKERADNAKKRAEKDGLYKPYVQQKIVNTVPVAAKKTTTKKPVAKKTTKK
ncbi:M48 family metalloprotease [Flavobacterium hydatis]|jgi:putative metalloprotease|uniref:Peptidase n=1 Tax=Flavobacterium hydatis TaxID=991 RepID=A0A085ZYW8_FLAHY|nr:M48 family metalloprotease [Flavobacterium hydatis]KFF09632.1 peptidase [Flavobacterium hydatis]OXA95046.1 peptidase [Flavobacterium hydatis]